MQQSGACRGSPRWPSDTPVAPHLLRDLSSRGSGSRRRPESRSRSRSRRRCRRRRRRRQLRRSRRRLEALSRCQRPPNYRFVGGANRPTPPAPDSANVYFRGSRGWPVAGCRRARDLSPDRVASFLALLGQICFPFVTSFVVFFLSLSLSFFLLAYFRRKQFRSSFTFRTLTQGVILFFLTITQEAVLFFIDLKKLCLRDSFPRFSRGDRTLFLTRGVGRARALQTSSKPEEHSRSIPQITTIIIPFDLIFSNHNPFPNSQSLSLKRPISNGNQVA